MNRQGPATVKPPQRVRRDKVRLLPTLTAGALILAVSLVSLNCAAPWRSTPSLLDDEYRESLASSRPLDEFRAARDASGGRTLVAGAARVDLTPYDRDVWIAGFGQMRRSKGVLDPIFGRALFLDDGESCLVLVSLDLIGITLSSVERIRALVSEAHRDRIIICTTHNHEGPDVIGYWGPGLLLPVASGVDPSYLEWVEHEVALCINAAVSAAGPARLRFGTATAPPEISQNLWYEGDPTKKFDGIGVMRVEAAGAGEAGPGETIATVVNFDMHAEALFGKNRLISADWPGRLCRALERKAGGTALCFCGAVGGMIIPYPNLFSVRADWSITERVEWIEEVGEILSDRAVEAVSDGSELYGDGSIRIDVRKARIPVPMENWIFRLALSLGIIDWRDRGFEPEGGVPVEVYLIDLGPARILTLPGEIFWSMGLYFRSILPGPHRFIFGLANDEIGYIMSAGEFENPTYGYEQSMSMGPETGMLIMEAVEEMLGITDEEGRAGYPAVR